MVGIIIAKRASIIVIHPVVAEKLTIKIVVESVTMGTGKITVADKSFATVIKMKATCGCRMKKANSRFGILVFIVLSGVSADAREFGGYECTTDCSGHKAGYEWAEA